MENGYASVRQIEKMCKTDIRFMWLLDGSPAPSFMTIDNFMNQKLVGAIEYLEEIQAQFVSLTGFDPQTKVRGRGHHKSVEQKLYDRLVEYTEKLKKYAEHIRSCGEDRNSYSKTDHDATFMRMKRDYMGNDQLLPGYNIRLGACDEFIAVYDVRQYASDMDCFKPLMENHLKLLAASAAA